MTPDTWLGRALRLVLTLLCFAWMLTACSTPLELNDARPCEAPGTVDIDTGEVTPPNC